MAIVVIYNPRSGSVPPLGDLKRHFKEAGLDVEAFIDATKGLKPLKQWQDDKNNIVAAVGGDGTLSSVAAAMVGSKAAFAPLPAGTLNHFTKDLNIPQDLPEAIKNLTHAKRRAVDVAMINGTVFINNSSIGLYPSSLQTREELEAQRVGKWISAVVASIKAFIRYRLHTVTVNGETFKTPFIFVGNNDYHLEEAINSGRSNLGAGKLSVYAVASSSRWSLAKIIAGAILGRLVLTRDIKIWKTTELIVHTKKKVVKVSRDGELEKITSPLKYEIIPKALIVIGSS